MADLGNLVVRPTGSVKFWILLATLLTTIERLDVVFRGWKEESVVTDFTGSSVGTTVVTNKSLKI